MVVYVTSFFPYKLHISRALPTSRCTFKYSGKPEVRSGTTAGGTMLLLPTDPLWPWGRLRPGIFLGVKGGRPARKADKLNANCEPIV
jgi:hypothetical protein